MEIPNNRESQRTTRRETNGPDVFRRIFRTPNNDDGGIFGGACRAVDGFFQLIYKLIKNVAITTVLLLCSYLGFLALRAILIKIHQG